MNCPRCGEICRCYSEPPPSHLPTLEGSASTSTEASKPLTATEPDAAGGVLVTGPPESPALPPDAWRGEISARLHRYRARRRIRPPRYPSLQLPFGSRLTSGDAIASPAFEPMSDQALALDGMSEVSSPAASPDPPAQQVASPREAAPEERFTAKIIEFPRFAWGPPAPPDDQLAEPVADRPRILEAPEAAPPPPALGGITIEAVEPKEAEKRPGIDIPLQAASLLRRILAGGIDGLIVAAASTLFGFIFWKVAAVRPPQLQIVALGAGIPLILWAAYQYLLIVYAATTPGLRAAGLRLARFNGTATSRSLRRWRILASYLSAASLGMGYVWVFLDEDALCWHDRTTHTYLAPANRPLSGS